jgi:hypothetical protein
MLNCGIYWERDYPRLGLTPTNLHTQPRNQLILFGFLFQHGSDALN